MKIAFCTLAMFACVAAPSYSQTAGAAYAELAGPGYFYSVNAELLAATPVFDRYGVYPWAGISIGKAYPAPIAEGGP